jgi:cell wall assembly regulator SMI1
MSIDWQPYLDNVPAITIEAIAGIEKDLGLKIPADLRDDFMQHPGMAPLPDGIDLPDGGNTGVGPILIPADDDRSNSYSVHFALSALQEWAGATKAADLKLLPFGTNTASGWFCLDYGRDSNNPVVVFIDTGYDFGEKGARQEVAKSFSDFLSRLN